MQVQASHGVIQVEEPSTWQRLAPQELVIQPKSGAVRIRVLSGRRVSPEVKRGVDQHASPLYRRELSAPACTLRLPASPDARNADASMTHLCVRRLQQGWGIVSVILC